MEPVWDPFQYKFRLEKAKQMKRHHFSYLSIIIAFLLFVVAACDTEYLTDPCSDCYEEKPTVGLISVNVSPSSRYDSIPLRIIKGKLEGGELYIQDTLTEEFAEFWVEVGFFYTVEATYSNESKKILAVDGDRVTVYLDQSNCDVDCWRPNDGEADCRLK